MNDILDLDKGSMDNELLPSHVMVGMGDRAYLFIITGHFHLYMN